MHFLLKSCCLHPLTLSDTLRETSIGHNEMVSLYTLGFREGFMGTSVQLGLHPIPNCGKTRGL